MHDRCFTLNANLPVILLIMLISVIGCSVDNPVRPSEQSPSDRDGIEYTKTDNGAVACFNEHEYVEAMIRAPSKLWAKIAVNPTDISGSRVDLSWKDNSENESGFRIERRTGIEGTWRVIGQVGSNVVLFQDMRLESNKTYYYRVQAYRMTLYSGYSNISSATTGDTNFNPKPSI